MESINIPYKDTGYFSKIMLDYLEQKECIQPFYHRFPTLENFEAQIKEKQNAYPLENRAILVSALQNQYSDFVIDKIVEKNIDSLLVENTFTITTGHQLNLFSGPLYFLYKIISVINLCKELKAKYPEQNFVPIYWMASEDHDFEEIQYFNFQGNKITWDRESNGPVGRLSTQGLDSVFEQFSKLLNTGKNADELRDLFQKAYLDFDNLGKASRYLVNQLFGSYGLVVVDGDDAQLKSLFKPYAVKELEEQITYKNVSKTNKDLASENYPLQVTPRETNLFYISDELRERIIKTEKGFTVNNTSLEFKNAEALFLNVDKREFMSGNALLRPLYQEVILPNLCYIGGGGELAYWMQLKATFNEFKVPFPMLLLRNSALLVSEKQKRKAAKLKVAIQDFFLSQNELIQKKVKEFSDIDYDFEEKRALLLKTFKELEALSIRTDSSFIGAVKAQKEKQLKGLNNLEKRLLKAEKRKMYELVTRIELLQNQLFPNQSLEERQKNFSDYYEEYGNKLILELFSALNPLDQTFKVIFL